MNAHHELNVKDIEISTLKMQNEQLQNDLRREKEISESLKNLIKLSSILNIYWNHQDSEMTLQD